MARQKRGLTIKEVENLLRSRYIIQELKNVQRFDRYADTWQSVASTMLTVIFHFMSIVGFIVSIVILAYLSQSTTIPDMFMNVLIFMGVLTFIFSIYSLLFRLISKNKMKRLREI